MFKPKLKEIRESLIKELKMCRREEIEEVSITWFAEWAETLLDVLEEMEKRAEKGNTVFEAIIKR